MQGDFAKVCSSPRSWSADKEPLRLLWKGCLAQCACVGHQGSQKFTDGGLADDSDELKPLAGRVVLLFVKMNKIFVLSKKTQRSVLKQAAFPVGTKPGSQFLMGFLRCLEGRLQKGGGEEERRKRESGLLGEAGPGCCAGLGCPAWSSTFSPPLAFWRNVSGPHASLPFVIRKTKVK